MIKRTPQEIADFFGCYVARDADRRWHIFKEKPELELGYHRQKNTNIKDGIYLNPELINTDNVYQLAVLYEPHSDNKDTANYPKPTDPDNEEYCILGHALSRTLSKLVNDAMKEGWKPCGGVTVEHLPKADGYVDDCQYFYQAMVRGV